MFKSLESPRPRMPRSQLDRVAEDDVKTRVGLQGLTWAGLGLFVILLTLLLLLLIDGRTVVQAAERKEAPWTTALQAHDWATMAKVAKSEATKNPRNAEAQNALGMALMELGKLDEAEVALITAESLQPSLLDYKVDLANLYARRGSTELVATKLKDALELDPSQVDLRWRLARALFTLKDYDGSLEQLRVINQLQPDNWDAYRLTADVASGRRKFQEAIDNLKLYTAVVPDARAWAKMALAFMSLSPPDTASARQAAEKSLELNPDDTQAHFALARLALMAADRVGRDRKLDQAKAYTDDALVHYAAVQKFSLQPVDLKIIGRVESMKKRLPEAERAYRSAAEIDTTSKDYLTLLAENLMAQQKYDDALDAYDAIIALDPKNESVLVNKGMAEMQASHVEKAEASFNKALEINPNYAAAQTGLGDIFTARGAEGQALTMYRSALGNSPDKVTCGRAAAGAGYILWKQGNYTEGVTVLKQGLGCDECNAQAALTLANCYQKLGQKAEGVAMLKRALSCDPTNSALRQSLQALGGQ